jgi:zinc protease
MPAAALDPTDFKLLQQLWRDAPERETLPNGLTLILQPDPAAKVASVQVWVKTGSIHEGAQLGAGLSHYLEHLLFKGTARRAGREISATVQGMGGYINAYTSFDRTVYYIDAPVVHVAAAIDVLADIVLHSTLPPAEVEREQQVILREIDMGQDDPDQRLGQNLFDLAFREHPYRYPVIGHREVFAAVSRDDLWTYYQARYVPNNLVVVVAGAADPTLVRAEVRRHFGAAARRRLAPVYLPEEPPLLTPRSRHLEEKVELVRGGLAWPIPGLAHADSPVLDVLAALLGHGDSCRLWQEVREKARLVHGIDATSWNPGSAGLFYLSFTCDAGRREAAETAIHRVIREAGIGGFHATEIRKVVRQMVVAEINGRRTASGRAARLGMAEVVVGDLDYSRRYFERLRAVTPARLREVLRRYLTPERLLAVSSNPPAPAAVRTAPARKRVEAKPTVHRLSNGARMVLLPDDRLPNLHLRLMAMGGPASDPVDRRGATVLLATMLTRDTQRRSAAAVARRIEQVGGSFRPFTGNNSFGLGLEVLPGDVACALDLLGEGVLRPAFKAASIAVERDAQLAELAQDDDDVVTFGRKHLRRLFFGAHPLAIEPGGDAAGLARMEGRVLGALHRRLLVAPNVVLAVAGDFDPRQLVPRLEAWLATLPPSRRRPGETPPVLISGAGGEHVVTRDCQQAVVFAAYPGPGLRDEDFYAAEVADELFSGMASRLFERVREELGLAYFVRSARVTALRGGMFYFFAGTAPGQENKVMAEFDREVKRVAAGKVSRVEIARCQTRLLAAREMGRQTNAARAMHAGLNVLYGMPADDEAAYTAGVRAIDAAALAVLARRYFVPGVRTRLVVRP